MSVILYQCVCNNVFYSAEERDACTHEKPLPDFSKCPFCGRDWPVSEEETP